MQLETRMKGILEDNHYIYIIYNIYNNIYYNIDIYTDSYRMYIDNIEYILDKDIVNKLISSDNSLLKYIENII